MMVRIKDIAIKANVSTATVSYVLNNTGNIGVETRARVLNVIKELDYMPNNIAKSLKIKKTSTIGVIVEDITVFNAAEIIDGINEYAAQHGFSIILTNLRLYKLLGNDFTSIEKCIEIIPKVIEDLLSRQVEGIIYIGVHTRDVTGIISNINKPLVYTYCYTSIETDYSVNYDDESAAYDVTNYLIQLGHSKIAVISGLINSVPSHARFNGYCKALKQYNLTFDSTFVKTGDWEYDSGYSMAKELLSQRDKPTAIIAMNDLMAGGVLEACRELRIDVPNELSVVGFDNRECSFYYTPKLTTVSLPLNEMGKRAMEIAVNLKVDPKIIKHHKLKCNIIKRDSVKSIN